MIDSKLIKQLDSPDVEARKKAVKALAQTKDPDALKYLATLYKTDDDPEVRDLALKAGKYIKKFSDSAPPGGRATAFSTPLGDEEEDDVYPAGSGQAEPRPEEIEVSEADQERAHSYVQMAMNHHMHGDNARAFQSLAKAFEANPKLKHDSYTTGLATTITGRALDVTLEMLEPSIERGTLRATRGAGEGPVRSGAHTRVAFLLLVGVAILFSGYLAMPWFDVGGLEINDSTSGQTMTMNEFFQQLRDATNAQIDAASASGVVSAADAARIKDALSGLKLNFTGLEVALVGTGLSDVLDVMGFNAVMTAIGAPPMQTTQDASPPPILDYTLLLLPAVAVLLLVLALMLVVGSSASTTLWLLTMVFSLGALVPVLHFLSDSLRFIITDSPDLSEIGSFANMPNSATAFIAIGFWVSMVGLVIIIISPVLAFLLPNPAAKQKQKMKVA